MAAEETTQKSAACLAAEERAEAWRKLSPEDQLNLLDARLGKGVGAGKQRQKLAKQLADREEARKAKKTGLKGGAQPAPTQEAKTSESPKKGPASPSKGKKT